MIDAIRELMFYKGGWFVAKMAVLLALIAAVAIIIMTELINLGR